MISNVCGDKPFKEFMNFRNADTVTIPPGTPVVFVINGTEDGFAAVLPATAGAAKCPQLFAGVYSGSKSLDINTVGEVQIWGLCNYAIIQLNSRAASTNSWASAAALSVGQPLQLDTVNNAWKTSAQVTGAFTVQTNTGATDTVAMNFGNGNPPIAVMAQTFSSASSSASTSSDTRVAIIAGLKVFLRAM